MPAVVDSCSIHHLLDDTDHALLEFVNVEFDFHHIDHHVQTFCTSDEHLCLVSTPSSAEGERADDNFTFETSFHEGILSEELLLQDSSMKATLMIKARWFASEDKSWHTILSPVADARNGIIWIKASIPATDVSRAVLRVQRLVAGEWQSFRLIGSHTVTLKVPHLKKGGLPCSSEDESVEFHLQQEHVHQQTANVRSECRAKPMRNPKRMCDCGVQPFSGTTAWLLKMDAKLTSSTYDHSPLRTQLTYQTPAGECTVESCPFILRSSTRGKGNTTGKSPRLYVKTSEYWESSKCKKARISDASSGSAEQPASSPLQLEEVQHSGLQWHSIPQIG